MTQLNGCSTHATKSGAAKQWFEELVQKKNYIMNRVLLF